SGAGKSSFINALRGIGPEEEGAAKTGVVETTMERHPYNHPKIPNVVFWDLPGIGTTKFPPKDYLKKMKFNEYEFFIILSATRFKKNDIDLAKAIRRMKKDFYFVRTKVDSDLRNEKECKQQTFDREEVLQQIRSSCVRTFQENKVEVPPIFLISNNILSDYDFQILMDKVVNDLPVYKRHNFMLSLPRITHAAIEMKRHFLEQKIWIQAFAFGLLIVNPSRTILMVKDVENLRNSINHYRAVFGVDDASLQGLAEEWQVSVDQLKAKMKSPHVFETTKEETIHERLSRLCEEFRLAKGDIIPNNVHDKELFYLQFYFLDMVTDDANALLREICVKNNLVSD
ncbi:interferon-inducible GTPase 1-like, partial [Alexandromys fortis]|uniref:interferon-inducible GTPase 1-like n=1 Tax=Alexandromys fortis TaxID=100897 RepID=UPI002152F5A1